MSTKFTYWGPKYKKPRKFPKDLQQIKKNSFTNTTPLANNCNITGAEMARALYETGYGGYKDWSDFLSFDAKDKAELFNFLMCRKNWILSAFTVFNGKISPFEFSRIIETSEWGSISYYLGQAGARLSADRWMASTRTVTRALHNSLYTSEAFIKTGALMQVTSRSEKSPDLLVQDNMGDWHIFEAKGGCSTYRAEAVTKGLEQLDSITGIGVGYTCNAPTSSVCSFTMVNRLKNGKSELSFDVVDPPTNSPKAVKSKAEQPRIADLYFLPDVSELRSAIFSAYLIEQCPIEKISEQKRIIRKGPFPGVYIIPSTINFKSAEEQIIIFDEIRKILRFFFLKEKMEIFMDKSLLIDELMKWHNNRHPHVSSPTFFSVINILVNAYKPTFEMDSPEYRLLAIIEDAMDFKENLINLRKSHKESTEFARSLFADDIEAIFPAQSGGAFVQVNSKHN